METQGRAPGSETLAKFRLQGRTQWTKLAARSDIVETVNFTVGLNGKNRSPRSDLMGVQGRTTRSDIQGKNRSPRSDLMGVQGRTQWKKIKSKVGHNGQLHKVGHMEKSKSKSKVNSRSDIMENFTRSDYMEKVKVKGRTYGHLTRSDTMEKFTSPRPWKVHGNLKF